MRPLFFSIQSRIIWLHIAALMGISLAVSSAAYLLLNTTVENFERRILTDRAASIANFLRIQDGKWTLHWPPELAATYDHLYGGFSLNIVDGDGQIIYAPPAAAHAPPPHQPRNDGRTDFGQTGDPGASYSIDVPVRDGGRTAWIEIAQNLEDPDVIVDDVTAIFLKRISLVVLPIFIVLLLIDIIIFRRALAPILRASALAQAIGPATTNIRLPTAALPKEVQPLSRAVNQALDRLEEGFRNQREFTADAAHELRTPLSVLRMRAEMMSDKTASELLKYDIDAMTRIVDQLLQLAELDSFSVAPGEISDLNDICKNVVAAMAPVALAQGKSLALISSDQFAPIEGNAELLERAVRNLVDNAIRHTRPDSCVEVEVGDGKITVNDRGPGVPDAERALIFQRFWRRDRSNKEHSGLGLSIVDRIAKLHRCAIDVAARAGGGASFVLIFSSADEV
jgi:signal transduction histidine kinase